MGRTKTGFAYLDDAPDTVIAMAHRGGAAHADLVGLENTRYAFQHAVDLGYTYLETDVHATSDGVLLAFHDESLDRVTDQVGEVAGMHSTDVARARIGEDHPVPTLEELFALFPGARFNIDLKADAAIEPLVALLDHTAAHDRVCVGSFSASRLGRFRTLTAGRVATSASPAEVVAFVLLGSRSASRVTRGRASALQVPRRRGRVPIVTRRLVRRAHAVGVQVHVWTVDDPEEMEELLDLGVDGLISDRTDLLKDVLVRRGLWREPQ